MPTFQQYQHEFVESVTGGRTAAAGAGMLPRLRALLDALPYFADTAFDAAHRGGLRTLLQVNMANDQIAAQPSDAGWTAYTSYQYEGPYRGYADAFCSGRASTPASRAVAAAVQAVNGGLNGDWWRDYALAVLTDAARQACALSLDTGKIAGDLSNRNTAFQAALAASCLATLRVAYQPTATALNDLASANQIAQANVELTAALSDSQFTANINLSIAMGGMAAQAAVWFLFCLWLTLTALGTADVDTLIKSLQAGGLTVPDQVGPGRWWTGGYTTWYVPLAGPDLAPGTQGNLTAGMPMLKMTAFGGEYPPPPVSAHIAPANGYSWSLCVWGPLARFPPQSDSCLGAGTGVLMADGSVQPIEAIQIGDQVRSDSDDGAGTVVLVEKPARRGRPLYSINGLSVFATSGHPFRSTDGPLRRAVDPWTLMDAVVTMVPDGVGALAPGVRLAGVNGTTVEVRDVTEHPTPSDTVYDLIIDNGGRGHGVYYVGGPDVFVAVDAESADPLRDVPSTLGVAAAMAAALPSIRQHPITALPGAPLGISLSDVEPATDLPAIPGADYFLLDGEWDEHAAMLEAHVVRHYGRMLRRQTAWHDDRTHDDRLHVCVRDIELVGDVRVDGDIELELVVRTGDTAVTRQMPIVATTTRSRWHLTPDVPVDFGRVPTPAELFGTLRAGGDFVGHFRAPIVANAPIIEHFLFGERGTVIGRVALDPRRAHRRTGPRAKTTAVAIGRRIGARIAENTGLGSDM